jgi:hypothetical protein
MRSATDRYFLEERVGNFRARFSLNGGSFLAHLIQCAYPHLYAVPADQISDLPSKQQRDLYRTLRTTAAACVKNNPLPIPGSSGGGPPGTASPRSRNAPHPSWKKLILGKYVHPPPAQTQPPLRGRVCKKRSASAASCLPYKSLPSCETSPARCGRPSGAYPDYVRNRFAPPLGQFSGRRILSKNGLGFSHFIYERF